MIFKKKKKTLFSKIIGENSFFIANFACSKEIFIVNFTFPNFPFKNRINISKFVLALQFKTFP